MTFDHLPQAVLMGILHQLAMLLRGGAEGDVDAARQDAVAMLKSYNPRTEAELRLAARVVIYNLQSGEALAQAANREMPIPRVLRLRSGAIMLCQEADKAESRLEQLRAARAAGRPEPRLEPEPRGIAAISALIEESRRVAAYAQAHGLAWPEAFKQRQRDQRVAGRKGRPGQAATTST
ncbi:MAG TPA: hypothetical protein VHB27_08600 [Rhodopila sp.]|uniref:hypothetical protein n=1 Tax=Rhodopila sp. TaxID=2480087 RepID=UPI002CA3C66A|nr:hypothetical protein [Rhodopila sp.]HVY15273.1 hypothetical protein [Rhodopila sp.]